MKLQMKIPENYNGLYFEQNKIDEKFEQILNYYGIKIYDAEHAISRFRERFPNLTIMDYKKVFLDGLNIIMNKYNFEIYNYAIISKSKKIKIPVEIRPDRYSGNLVGVTGTTLHKDDQKFNTRNEIEILVEQSKKENALIKVPEFEDHLNETSYEYHWYNHYFESGNYYQDFKYIEVE